MIHQMSLQSNPFRQIKEATKTIEIRLYDEKRRKIKIGDQIEFSLENEKSEKLRVEVIGLLNYKTFSDLIDDFPAHIFGRSNKEELLQALYTYYTEEEENQNTVLGIKINLVK